MKNSETCPRVLGRATDYRKRFKNNYPALSLMSLAMLFTWSDYMAESSLSLEGDSSFFLFSTLGFAAAALVVMAFGRQREHIDHRFMVLILLGIVCALGTLGCLILAEFTQSVIYILCAAVTGITMAWLFVDTARSYSQQSFLQGLTYALFARILSVLILFFMWGLGSVAELVIATLLPLCAVFLLLFDSPTHETELPGVQAGRANRRDGLPGRRFVTLCLLAGFLCFAFRNVQGRTYGAFVSFEGQSLSAANSFSGEAVEVALLICCLLVILLFNFTRLGGKELFGLLAAIAVFVVAGFLLSPYIGVQVAWFDYACRVLLSLFNALLWGGFPRIARTAAGNLTKALGSFAFITTVLALLGFLSGLILGMNAPEYSPALAIDGILIALILIGGMIYMLLRKDFALVTDVLNQDAQHDSSETVSIDNLELVDSESIRQLAADFDLTEREMQIVSYLARGGTASYIASELTISSNTVKTHIRNIYAKVHVNSRDELLILLDDDDL